MADAFLAALGVHADAFPNGGRNSRRRFDTRSRSSFSQSPLSLRDSAGQRLRPRLRWRERRHREQVHFRLD